MIFRIITTGTPAELKNYIVKNASVEKAYSEFKNDLAIYEIDIRIPFAIGDALFVDNIYYIEKAENLQLTLRFKTNRTDNIVHLHPEFLDSSEYPFKFCLKVSDTSTTTSEAADDDSEVDLTGADWNYVILETVDEHTVGKVTDKYRYFVVSFDDVKINYANTKVELYMFANSPNRDGEFDFTEDEKKVLARFTVFDVNTPKSKVQAKKFGFDK